MKKIAVAMIASLVLAGCAPQPERLTIRTLPDPRVCPMAVIPVPMRFRIDPLAQEQVIAFARDGRPFHVWWAPEFQAGDVTDPVVRDPKGEVVARDGEVLEGPLLHGHTVCATDDSIYILLI